MDTVLRGLPFILIYLDDILIHSRTLQLHMEHLRIVFERLSAAGLTLRGRKCHIGLPRVSYLGHVFSGKGMEPDTHKLKAITSWPIPTELSGVRKFLGLASYYRRYIPRFSEIAEPLSALTRKGATFDWTQECTESFNMLRTKLGAAPVLTYPKFSQNAAPFAVLTDASQIGLGAILEQDGHVIAYASRSLKPAERNYSVIQRECLAVVYALKQFRHYLLGRHFKIYSDHAPLQWLSAQKMEGLLCRWALAIQEYDFAICYKKGSDNRNADALSRHPCATTVVSQQKAVANIRLAQQADKTISTLLITLKKTNKCPSSRIWKRYPLKRYRQLWNQLTVKNGILCRKYVPGPLQEEVTVPILPPCLRKGALHQCHDPPTAGHQGVEKTLDRLRKEAYWVGIATDVRKFCRNCTTCQASKLVSPARAPLTNTPIGRPWQMVAADILEVPVSSNNNRYLLVVQDYFTKWVEAIPLPDQTATRITKELVKIFTTYGCPDILHSDQGRNFESTILRSTLKELGVTKSRTTAYHPQGDGMVERFNRSLLQLLRSYVEHQNDWEQFLPLVLFAYRTTIHSSTGCSPFTLMFGRSPSSPTYSSSTGFNTATYTENLQYKLAELRDFVECHLTNAAEHQKSHYDENTVTRNFCIGDTVWLSRPTAGKLDPHWEGGWKVKRVLSPLTVEITDGQKIKCVHINRLHHRLQPDLESSVPEHIHPPNWQPPTVDHLVLPPAPRRYPLRHRVPPDRYGYQDS